MSGKGVFRPDWSLHAWQGAVSIDFVPYLYRKAMIPHTDVLGIIPSLPHSHHLRIRTICDCTPACIETLDHSTGNSSGYEMKENEYYV